MRSLANLADLAHVHLLLNHFPTIGTILGLGLLSLAFVRRNGQLQKVSLEVFFLIALATLPVYVSGVAAQQALKDQAGVSAAAMATHQDAALLAFIVMELTGAVAWLGLWQFRRIGRPTAATTSAVLLLSAVTVTLMARAANLGGAIRHPEILTGRYSSPGGTARAASAAWLTSASVGKFVLGHSWAWPTLETLHFVGMSLMFGVLMVVNLRLLGWMRGMSFAAAHRLLPLGILGFGVNFVTGMLFFIAASQQYTENVAFHWKMILLELAGVNFLVLTVFDGGWALPAGAEASFSGQLLGASALFLLVGVMYFGRMLPFIGNSF